MLFIFIMHVEIKPPGMTHKWRIATMGHWLLSATLTNLTNLVNLANLTDPVNLVNLVNLPTWRRTLWQPTSWHPASHSTARISQAQTQSRMNGKQASGPSPPRHNFDQSQPGRGRRSQFRPIWGSRGGEGGGGEHLWVKVLGRGWISFPLSWWVGPSLVTNLRISFNALQLLKKHCQRHNGLKALSTLTYPTPPILP